MHVQVVHMAYVSLNAQAQTFGPLDGLDLIVTWSHARLLAVA